MDREAFEKVHRQLIARLLRKVVANTPVLEGLVSEASFAETLHRSAEHRFRDANPSGGETATYLESLHVEDLALARACADGHDTAWEHFITRFRPILYAAAGAITRDEASGRELADSIYAELYGLDRKSSSGKPRGQPLFSYFHGRSTLATWLRAVLAQRWVDVARAHRRTEPLSDDAAASHAADPAGSSSAPDPDRQRYLDLLHDALTAALGRLESRDRLRLSCYYVRELTLAEVGRLFGEHEATVSRKLNRTRHELREEVERSLTDGQRLTADEIRLCYDYALEEWPFDLTRALASEE